MKTSSKENVKLYYQKKTWERKNKEVTEGIEGNVKFQSTKPVQNVLENYLTKNQGKKSQGRTWVRK